MICPVMLKTVNCTQNYVDMHNHTFPQLCILLRSSTWTICCIVSLQMKQADAAVITVSADSVVAYDLSTAASTASQSELSTAARDGSVTQSHWLNSLEHTRTLSDVTTVTTSPNGLFTNVCRSSDSVVAALQPASHDVREARA